jgi:hypothetical protein
LMRATAGLGILTQTPDGRWEQTPMSDVLRSDATKTLRHFACLISDDWHVRALGSLDETVRTGEQATEASASFPSAIGTPNLQCVRARANTINRCNNAGGKTRELSRNLGDMQVRRQLFETAI